VKDILPTCLEVAGAVYPEQMNNQHTAPPTGKSLWPLLNSQAAAIHDTLYWEHVRGKAIRAGKWKMSAHRNAPWELFDMEIDHTETSDLAGQYPEKVAKMDEAWTKWARKLNIIPHKKQ
jgi:arylsulfatase